MALRSVASQGAELTAGLTSRLAAVASELDLNDAWAEYDAIVDTVRENDLRQLHRFEGVAEHETGDDRVLVRLPMPMSERLLDDLDDAWARLRGKELATTLRSGGPSLRAIAGQVSVSAPYLSQLANGAGPVPSRTVLGKLEAGLANLGIDVPKSPVPPKDLLEPIRQRVALLRERLSDAERRQTTPQVTVNYPDQRIARKLEDQFEALATRSLDLDGGVPVRDLIAALIEEDDSVLDVLTLAVRDESLQKAILAIASLEGDVKRHLLGFLGALVPRAPAVTRPRRDTKASTPQKSEIARADD